MKYYELQPAYGRDYKNKAEVVAAFNEGKDFDGDYSLGFKLVNKPQLEEMKPCTVNLRYKGNRSIAQVKL